MSAIATEASYSSLKSAFVPLLFITAFIGTALFPRIALSSDLLHVHLLIFGLLLAWFAFLLFRAIASGQTFQYVPFIRTPHYVQAAIQISIYGYWGWAWEFIYHNSLLILSQLLFAFAFDALFSWSRGRVWRLGLGPCPIVFSINFFSFFKDHWFIYQFGIIVLGFLFKEFATWTRDGRKVHIFNPSAITLFIFSLGLLFTNTTDLTWAEELAIDLNRPTNIYLFIFVAGLIVQSLFQVTLITLASGATLYLLNLIYTQITGVYWFLDAGIPIAVFLGIHLLVTDPATSPRTELGRVIFGCLYGVGVFALYGLLEKLGQPRGFDKLLFVPLLNLLVIQLDKLGSPQSKITRVIYAWIPDFLLGLDAKRLNYIHMAIWICLFTVMYQTRFVGPTHVGQSIGFWEDACQQGKHNGCKMFAALNSEYCTDGNIARCDALAEVHKAHPDTVNNDVGIVRDYALACEMGSKVGCMEFNRNYNQIARGKLDNACAEGNDSFSCYILGASFLKGYGEPVKLPVAFEYFDKACVQGLPVGCYTVGEMYRYGVGISKDLELAASHFKNACDRGHGLGCFSLSMLYGKEGGLDKNLSLSKWYRLNACVVGFGQACDQEKSPVR